MTGPLRAFAASALALTAAAALVATSPGCSKADASKGDAKGPAAVPVDVGIARVGSVQRTVDVVGTLFGEEDATISNKVNGKIIAIYKDVGDRAEPGEPLAQLLQNDYLLDLNQKRAALQESLAKLGLPQMPGDRFKAFDVTALPSVRRASFQMQSAESRFQRGKQLHESKPPLISDQDFEDLQTTWSVAKNAYEAEMLASRGLVGEAQTRHAELLIAEQALRDTTVRAPSAKYDAPDMEMDAALAGMATPVRPSTRPADAAAAAGSSQRVYFVAARMGSEGELEKAVTPLFRLVDDDPLKLRANVPERYFPELKVGQKAAVKIESTTQPATGTISRINPQVDPVNRTFQVEAIVPNPDHGLPPGAFARAAIDTRTEDGVVFVPWSAVVTFAGVDKVFVVEPDRQDPKQPEKAREVPVTLGERRGDEIEVKKGLKGGERVATSGTGRVASGMAVVVKEKR